MNLQLVLILTGLVFQNALASNGGSPDSITVCENSEKNITCEDFKRIVILKAFYGRQRRDICPVNPNNTVSCSSHKNVQSVVKDQCECKVSCIVKSNNDVYNGDPCHGISKYTTVKYKCKAPNKQTPEVCCCPCSKVGNKWSHLQGHNLTYSELKEAMKQDLIELEKELAVDKKKTSSAIRRRTSARDDRKSSSNMGVFAIIITCLPICFCVCIDCSRYWCSGSTKKRRKRSKVAVDPLQSNELLQSK